MTDEAELAFLKLLFNNVAWANVGDVAGLRPSASAGSLYLSLHTSDPGEGGDQTTSEISYTGYDRVAVPRSSLGFDCTANPATLAALTPFAASSGGAGGIATYFGVGTALGGAGHLIGRGLLDSPMVVAAGVTPRLTAGTSFAAI